MTAVTSEAFARQLADLGVIAADLNGIERITITAEVAQPVTIRVDQFGDGRLAQAVADARPETIERYVSELSTQNHRLRELAAEILASYIKTGDGWRGRVGQVQVARWRDQLGGSQ